MSISENSPGSRGALARPATISSAAALSAVVLLAFAHTAQARRPIPPWCAWDPGMNGFNCGFYTHQQCMTDAWGNGGLCVPNPRAGYGAPRTRRRR